MRTSAIFISSFCFTLIALWAIEGQLAAREIGSEVDLCDKINLLQPGETLTLIPGDYRGPCKIRRGGTALSPVIIQGQSLIEKPRIIYDGQDNNVIEVMADFVTLRGLRFGPTKRNVAGVRILAGAGITIEDCEFSQLGGIAVAATRTSVDGLYVRRNMITDVKATAMYFGCHDGTGCQISNLIVERNFIKGVDAVDPEIGYGIQLKLNTTGVISDNIIADTKGPGIMVYGSLDPARPSLIERNFITGSRQSAGVLIGGGPAQVRNNIVSHNFEGGVTFQNYANRGLLRKIAVVNNTSFKNEFGEFVVPPQITLSATSIALNAAERSEGSRAFPTRQSGLNLWRNVECSTAACFSDPKSLNFSPLPASPLIRIGNLKNGSLPLDDYYGRSRSGRLTAGAVAFAGPPITLGIKPEH